MKPCRLRPRAGQDIDEAALHYAHEGGYALGAGFYDEVEAVLNFISANPKSGSPRYANLLDVPGLCVWRLKRFPYSIFYFEHDTHLDVVRVLHQSTDIPAHLEA
jgi:toxin ParE1/3/4